jgi:SnoaL-like domain
MGDIIAMPTVTDHAKEIVLDLGKAINEGNFHLARKYVSDDMRYVGPFGTREGAEAYLEEIERLRLKFDIQKLFAQDNDVCALYDITVAGIKIFACGWFQIKSGKVTSLRVVFDPRPLLAPSNHV